MTRVKPTSSSLYAVLVLAAITAGLDQTSKWLIVFGLNLQAGDAHTLLPFLDITLLWNRGISYGLFDAADAQAILIAVTSSVIALFIFMARRLTSKVMRASYGLIIGGAVGNLVDRIVHGAVVDFISPHVAGYYWYVFNLADIAISLGVALLFYDMVRGSSSDHETYA